MIISILWLFAVLVLLGLPVSLMLKKRYDSQAENMVLALLLGVPCFVIVSTAFNLLHVPLYWWVYLALGIFLLWLSSLKKGSLMPKAGLDFLKGRVRLKKDTITMIIVIFIALAVSIMMVKGAYNYPWLEDDDSWDHAAAAKYISTEHSARKTAEQTQMFGRLYLEPYPPAYPIMMGVAHQTNNSVSDTLKKINAILIGLGVLFFYLFAKEFLNSRNNALFATFVIATLPSFMSHFIWSQTLAVVAIFPAMYSIVMLKKADDASCKKTWFWISALAVSAVLLVQPSTSVIFGLFFGFMWLGYVMQDYSLKKDISKSINKEIIMVSCLAVVISMALFWGPMFLKYGVSGTLEGIGMSQGILTSSAVDTSGGIVYSFKDFLIAPSSSKIDQATGIGIAATLLAIFGVLMAFIYRENLKRVEVKIILFWLLFTIIGTEANALPFKLFPHRFWVFLAIPVALISAECVSIFVKNVKIDKSAKSFIFLVIIIGILITGLVPKYKVQTAVWPFGGNFGSYETIQGYVWMGQNLDKNTPVINLCGPEENVIGFDMMSYPLDIDIENFKSGIMNRSAVKISGFIKSRAYEYAVMDLNCVNKFGLNETNLKLNEMLSSQYFGLAHATQGFWLLKVI